MFEYKLFKLSRPETREKLKRENSKSDFSGSSSTQPHTGIRLSVLSTTSGIEMLSLFT